MQTCRIESRFWACAAVIALMVLLIPPLISQTVATEILGLVTDTTGAVVPGAKVTITRAATGETRTVETNRVGEYSFPLIPIGDYNVHVEMTAFKSQTITGLHVETEQKARQDFALELGQVAETMEVAARAVALKTDDATMGQVIANDSILDLPLNGRNMGQLAVLVPGVQYGVRTGMTDGMSGFPIPGTGMSIIANGVRELHNNILLDGIDVKN